MRTHLRKAMNDPDRWVVEFEYLDSKGNTTTRVVSPVRFLNAERFLALCLCREEPRQFYLNRCCNLRILEAEQVLMPVAIG